MDRSPGPPTGAPKDRPSLESLVESVGSGLAVLHPGGLAITRELAALCAIGAGSRVLDAAAGRGASACCLAAEFGCRMVGLDASEVMLRAARVTATARGVAVAFIRGDAHRLPFADGSFDAVISECTLCLLDKARAIREMVRVVRAGGRVGMHDLCWRSTTPDWIKRRLADIEGERPETPAAWTALFAQAGLTEVRGIDRGETIPEWIREAKKRLGLGGQAKMVLAALKRWGASGLRDVWQSQRIFQSRHTGYGIVVGRKP